jgi:hypothetical protein
MMTKKVELLSAPHNFAVVQLPDRSYPGVVVQGDTLNAMRQQMAKIIRLLNAGELDELSDEVRELNEQILDVLVHFEQVCESRGIKLPY